MDIFPRRTWPTLPGASSGKHLAPAAGAFLAAVFDYFCHLALIRHLGRPECDKPFDYDFNPLTTSPVGINQDLMVRFMAPPWAKHAFCAVQYTASPFAQSGPDLGFLGGGGAVPPVMRVVNTLLTHGAGGALDDPGMRWDYQDGTLPATVRINDVDWVEGVVNPAFANATYPPRWVVSGFDINDAPPAAVTRPRLLNVGSGANTLLRWRLVTENALITRAKIWVTPESVVSV